MIRAKITLNDSGYLDYKVPNLVFSGCFSSKAMIWLISCWHQDGNQHSYTLRDMKVSKHT